MEGWRVSCEDRPESTDLILESHSCRPSPTCKQRRADGGKKIKISTANVHDTVGILPVIDELARQGYSGPLLGDLGYCGETLAAVAEAQGMSVLTVANGT